MLQTQTADMRPGLNELEETQMIVSDGTAIHYRYGLVKMGGYVRLIELNPDQPSTGNGPTTFSAYNQTTESWICNWSGYRCQSRGGGEQAESEDDEDASGPITADGNPGPWTHVLDGIRDEVNNALRREHYSDRFDSMAPRQHLLYPSVSERYQGQAAVIRQMVTENLEASVGT